MNHYQQHRAALLKSLGGGTVIIAAFTRMQQTLDGAAPFVQESNFLYTTGVHEPNWIVIFNDNHATLVRPTRSRYEDVFYGAHDEDKLVKHAGVDEVISCDEFRTRLDALSGEVYTILPPTDDVEFTRNPAQSQLVELLQQASITPLDCRLQLAKLRAIKQPYEIDAIRRSVELTCQVFTEVRQKFSTYSNEREIDADFTHAFRRAGATHGYDPIVAAGVNAITLHYDRNDSELAQGDLVVIDIGAKLGDYTADVTRTYCVGQPSERQQQLFRGLQQVQRDIIESIAPGKSVRDYVKNADNLMKDFLIEVGLLRDRDDDKFRTYYPHATSHGLGLDTHDSLGRPETFQPGMVLTVEPGVYVPEEGIGIRLEDDILVTEDGRENLSASLSTDW